MKLAELRRQIHSPAARPFSDWIGLADRAGDRLVQRAEELGFTETTPAHHRTAEMEELATLAGIASQRAQNIDYDAWLRWMRTL